MTSTGRPYVYLGILHAGAVEAVVAALQHGRANTVVQTEGGQVVRPSPQACAPPVLPQHWESPPGPTKE
ncbi:hypothetical protein [Streptomyces sp. NBC_00236]|uniref:hypothetical protein n=1 Tax=Streptomyces sp. NBC_00236 TaxID=2903639 RepID=UPI002E29AE32|nr:hypothetical protein [Streptomyces sp. NBC_00236]